MDQDVVSALEKNNVNIIRYAKNQLEIIKRCVNDELLAKVIEGDIEAQESALKKIMLCSWEGPIVKFTDKENHKQDLRKGKRFTEDLFCSVINGWMRMF